MGPVVSLVITIIPLILLETMSRDERQTVILVTFLVVGGMFTLSSGIPRGLWNPTHRDGGVRNDAVQIMQLWNARNFPPVYWTAMDKFRETAYTEAAELLEKVIDEGHATAAIYRLALVAQFNSANYHRARQLSELIRENYRFGLEDGINDGLIKLMSGRYQEAVGVFRELLRLHYNHYLLLNHMGYALIAAGEAEQSLLYLDRGLTLMPRHAALYANRAWAKIELGGWEEGLADAQRAVKLNDTTGEAYRVLGLYAREKGELRSAKEYLLKAREINPRILFVDEPLADVGRRLEMIPTVEV